MIKIPKSKNKGKKYIEIPIGEKLSQIGFHGLRHTVGTRLLEKGVNIITVKEILAHSSLATTERYTHSNTERKQKAINILENY